MIKVNGTEIKKVNVNGNEVKKVNVNGVKVYEAKPEHIHNFYYSPKGSFHIKRCSCGFNKMEPHTFFDLIEYKELDRCFFCGQPKSNNNIGY